MDKTVLSIDDLIVESFTASSDAMVIGDHQTGCIPGDCPASAVTGCYC
jgi:hypothetical protein